MSANLYDLFAATFATRDDQICLQTESGAAITFAQLHRASARCANVLANFGYAKGERLAAQIDKSPEALILYLACLRAGLVFVPLNTAYQAGELEYFLGDAQAKIFVCRPRQAWPAQAIADKTGVAQVLTLGEDGSGTLAEIARDAGEDFATLACEPGDLAAILYTSGTTGRSKGAMLTHANLGANARTLVDYWGITARDVLLHSLPIFHIHGLFVACHTALLARARTIFLPRFDAKQVIAHLPRATLFMGVPTFYTRLLQEPSLDANACANMRLFISGSAPLLAETFHQFGSRTGHTILERYGMSETGMNTSNPLAGERKAGTVGLPLPGVTVRIVDDDDAALGAETIGNIQVKGTNVFTGYWRRPELNDSEFTLDGFFRTGDVGKFDAHGYLTIAGRSKDIVITGGLNVYPKEIESYLDEIPGVAESAVIGVPHADLGEALVAVTVLDKASKPVTEQYIIEYLKSRIAAFKVPKRVIRADELPRNAMGKVQKNVLRERLGKLFQG